MHPDYEQWLTDALAGADPPFQDELIELSTGSLSTFFELKNHPDVFVRQVPENVGTAELKKHMEQFDFMRSAGINVPKYTAIITHAGKAYADPGQPIHYLVAEKVFGEDLTSIDDQTILTDPQLGAAIERFGQGIVDYIQKCADADEPLAEDIHFAQIMYGTTASKPVPDLYMIDLDPLFADNPKYPRDKVWALYYLQMTLHELDKRHPIDSEMIKAFRSAVTDYCERNIPPNEREIVLTRIANNDWRNEASAS